ncbi:hypothetical protein [Methylobacillus sp.]|uniref:hypothetical protein n=1 Tax=Methylobacillus sp. TaxID=56818 RepID=UPI002FDF8CDF
MKASIVVGLLLIVFGVVSLVYQGFSYTTEETVVQLGSLKATAEVEKDVVIPQAVSIITIVAGIAVVALGARRK